MALQASKSCGFLSSYHHPLAPCMSNGINAKQVPGTIFMPRSCYGRGLRFARRIVFFFPLQFQLILAYTSEAFK
jgi:hypothetical protein